MKHRDSTATLHSHREGRPFRADQVELRVPSDPKLLKVVRSTIEYLCQLIGFDQDERNSIKLAVDEACSNIIRHAYDDRHDQEILVSCLILDNGIEIKLEDFGKQVDKKNIKSRDLEQIRPGGLGVHLIQSVMDVVQYDEDRPEGNHLTLIKYLETPEK